jgi:hypothetical protein
MEAEECLLAVSRELDLVAARSDQHGEVLPKVQIVFDDEDPSYRLPAGA